MKGLQSRSQASEPLGHNILMILLIIYIHYSPLYLGQFLLIIWADNIEFIFFICSIKRQSLLLTAGVQGYGVALISSHLLFFTFHCCLKVFSTISFFPSLFSISTCTSVARWFNCRGKQSALDRCTERGWSSQKMETSDVVVLGQPRVSLQSVQHTWEIFTAIWFFCKQQDITYTCVIWSSRNLNKVWRERSGSFPVV